MPNSIIHSEMPQFSRRQFLSYFSILGLSDQNCVNYIGGFFNVRFSAFAYQTAQLRPKGYGF